MLRWNITRKTIVITLALFICAINVLEAKQIIGRASYYSYEFNKRKTASGQIFNPEALTCAHRTFPFGTKLKVVNLYNGKGVTVVVNDRGPFTGGRIIDLSRLAAKRIDLLKSGTAKVSIEVIKTES